MLVEAENTVTSHFPVQKQEGSLEEMFDRLEIKVQGRKDEEVKSENSFAEDEEGSNDDLNQSLYIEDNKIS